MTRLRSLTVSPGSILRKFSEEEATQLVTDWLSIFGTNRQGANTKAFLWHIFSGARFPSTEGPAALDEYKQQIGKEFVVLSNDRKQAVLTDLLPSSCSLSDYYVFPLNYAWTMAFTHEAGWLGPYFARHPNYVEMNRKAIEAEFARQKGWR
jgi:Domain of unknown function (DUF4275)